MSFRGYEYDKLDRRVAEIETLIRAVTGNLCREIEQIEENF